MSEKVRDDLFGDDSDDEAPPPPPAEKEAKDDDSVGELIKDSDRKAASGTAEDPGDVFGDSSDEEDGGDVTTKKKY